MYTCTYILHMYTHYTRALIVVFCAAAECSQKRVRTRFCSARKALFDKSHIIRGVGRRKTFAKCTSARRISGGSAHNVFFHSIPAQVFAYALLYVQSMCMFFKATLYKFDWNVFSGGLFTQRQITRPCT